MAQAAARHRREQPRVPEAEQLADLLALGGARIAAHQLEQGLGHADLGGRRQARAAGGEGVADRIERAARAGPQLDGAHVNTLAGHEIVVERE